MVVVMPVLMVVVMVIMAAAALGTVLMLMSVIVRMVVSLGMAVPVPMIVMMVVVAALAMVVGGLFGLEGAGDRGGFAAGVADQGVGGDRNVEGFGADLGGDVLASELPGEAQQPGRVAGADFEERLVRRADGDQAPVLELQGVPVLQTGGVGEGELEAEAARGGEGAVRRAPAGMVERDRVDDLLGPDGGLADDQGGFGHGILEMGDGPAAFRRTHGGLRQKSHAPRRKRRNLDRSGAIHVHNG